MANESTFTIFLKTIADSTGVTQIGSAVQSQVTKIEQLNQRLQAGASIVNQAFAAVGIGLGIRQLNEYGQKALEVREQQAAFVLQVLRSKDGSQELVETLTRLNEQLEKTTGTTAGTSREIERQLLLFGATKTQVVDLTKSIIDFAAARQRYPQELAFVISRALSGEDIMLNRLGLHLDKTKSHVDQVNDLISQLGKTAGTAEAIARASGGMKEFAVEWEHLKIAIGNVVNLFRIPFLTSFTETITGAKQNIDELGKSYSGFGEKVFVISGLIGNWIGGIVVRYRDLAAGISAETDRVMQPIAAFILGVVTRVKEAAGILVQEAIIKLNELARFAAGTAKTLSLGAVSIDTTQFDKNITDARTKIGDLKKSTTTDLAEISSNLTAAQKKTAEELAATIDSIVKREANAPGIDELTKKYRTFIDSPKNISGQAGTGVITGDANATNATNATKAATDALSNAKFRLASAQEQYQLSLEQTKALEDAGAISSEQALQQQAGATRAYIAELENIKRTLPGIIAQLQKVGNTQGANELRLALQKANIEQIKLRTNLSNTTFFGQIRTQIRQLASEWGNLGKQIGGFVTQQFQNLAQTGGQVIAGLIFKTGNWKQSVAQLAQGFVASLAQMLIQWVLTRTIMAALNKAFGQADASATTGQASAAAAAWAPAATSASIASYGVAAGTGVAAYLAALGVGTAGAVAAAGLGGGSGGGFESGGYTGEFGGIVHKREFVFSAPAVRSIGLGMLQSMHTRAISSPRYEGGGYVGGGAGIPIGGIDPNDLKIEVYNFTDMRNLQAAWAKSPAGRKVLNDHSRKNRL